MILSMVGEAEGCPRGKIGAPCASGADCCSYFCSGGKCVRIGDSPIPSNDFNHAVELLEKEFKDKW